MVTYRRFDVYAFLSLSREYKWLSRDFYEHFCPQGYICDPRATVSLVELESWVTPRLGGDRELLPFLRQMQSKVCGHMKITPEELLPS